MNQNHDKLKQAVERQKRRAHKAEEDEKTLLAQTTYLGTLGLLLVLPILLGAYLGQWLDNPSEEYSFIWTLVLLILGGLLGLMNVYFFIQKRE